MPRLEMHVNMRTGLISLGDSGRQFRRHPVDLRDRCRPPARAPCQSTVNSRRGGRGRTRCASACAPAIEMSTCSVRPVGRGALEVGKIEPLHRRGARRRRRETVVQLASGFSSSSRARSTRHFGQALGFVPSRDGRDRSGRTEHDRRAGTAALLVDQWAGGLRLSRRRSTPARIGVDRQDQRRRPGDAGDLLVVAREELLLARRHRPGLLASMTTSYSAASRDWCDCGNDG